MSKNLFISLPMNGVSEVDILLTRDMIYKAMQKVGDFTLLETYFREDAPEDAGRLWYLGRSIQDLGKADLVIFAPGWNTAKGCVCEHFLCEVYKIPYVHWADTTDGIIKLMEEQRRAAEERSEDDLR